ncbi:histone H3.v1-like [Anoplophora glabripennis]|uniref:histone H3.v1-like n=1 Tax=Anoplophora glabripennis TaxID=217634 RepID=UPI000874450A|nr:histone H3.v1-like [Anoplophora glabripennis]
MWEDIDETELVNVTVKAEQHGSAVMHRDVEELQWETIDASQLINITMEAEQNVGEEEQEERDVLEEEEVEEEQDEPDIFQEEEVEEEEQNEHDVLEEEEEDEVQDEHNVLEEEEIEEEQDEPDVLEEEEMEISGNNNIEIGPLSTSTTASTNASSEEIRSRMVRQLSPNSDSSEEIRKQMKPSSATHEYLKNSNPQQHPPKKEKKLEKYVTQKPSQESARPTVSDRSPCASVAFTAEAHGDFYVLRSIVAIAPVEANRTAGPAGIRRFVERRSSCGRSHIDV